VSKAQVGSRAAGGNASPLIRLGKVQVQVTMILVFFYAVFSALAFIGIARIGGRELPTCGNVECRYDLAGLASGSPCPECGEVERLREGDAYTLIARPEIWRRVLLTLCPLALVLIAPYWLALVVRIPAGMRDGFVYRGQVDAAELLPFFVVTVIAPLTAKLGRASSTVKAMAWLFVIAYMVSAVIAMTL
jgi:hypothetical protein